MIRILTCPSNLPVCSPELNFRIAARGGLSSAGPSCPSTDGFQVSHVVIALFKSLFQDLVARNPIDASRLHGYRLHPTTLQPVGHTVQVSGKTFKSAYGLWVSVRSHSNVMRAVPHIYPCGMRIDYL